MTKATFNPRDHFGFSVGFGYFKNMEHASIFGRSSALGVNVVTDITSIPGLVTYVFPSNDGQLVEIVSTNAADTEVKYLVSGLDVDFRRVQEVVTVNGTAPVVLELTYTRINAIGNIGTKAHAGTVSVRDVGGGAVYSAALARAQESSVGVYTVPKGYSAGVMHIIQSMQKPMGAEDDVTVGIKYRLDRTDSGKPDGVFRIPFDSGIQRSGNSSTEFFNAFPEPLHGPCDLKLFATAETGGSVASARLALLLAKTTEST